MLRYIKVLVSARLIIWNTTQRGVDIKGRPNATALPQPQFYRCLHGVGMKLFRDYRIKMHYQCSQHACPVAEDYRNTRVVGAECLLLNSDSSQEVGVRLFQLALWAR